MDNRDGDDISFDHLMRQMVMHSQPSSLKDVLEGNDLISFSRLNPISLSSDYASLLLVPQLQSNNYRIEALVHLSLSIADGNLIATPDDIQKYFKKLNGTFCDYNEDPAEDLFLSVVHDNESTYKIFEGLWESSAFQLQRFVNLVDTFPNNDYYQPIRDSVKALLKISNELAERSSLQRNLLGNITPLESIPEELLSEVINGNRVKFTIEDLASLGISEVDLLPFIFDQAGKKRLGEVHFGDSPLERHPIVKSNNEYYVLLPSSLSVAIRIFLIDFSIGIEMYDALFASLYNDYIKTFSENIRILGELGPLPFQRFKADSGDIIGAQSLVSIDAGRFIHFILIFDDFKNYKDGYFNGCSLNLENTSQALAKQIDKTHEFAANQDDYRSGYSLVVLCGWGRPIALSFDSPIKDDWNIEYVSAADLATFSLDPDMNRLTFWRFLEAKERINSMGVTLVNTNGLLNLYAWAKINNYHLIPHEDLPEELDVGDLNHFMMMVEQNAIVQIRSDIMKAWDEHVAVDPDGRMLKVKRRSIKQYYSEDRDYPIYVSVDDILERKLLSLVYGKNIEWWSYLITRSETDKEFIDKMWEAAGTWLNKLDRVTDYSGITKVSWSFDFLDNQFPSKPPIPISYEELKKYIQVNSTLESGILSVHSVFTEGFVAGFHQENNDAEKAVIYSLVLGVTDILGDSDSIENVVSKVFDNADAKNVHMFQAQYFIDYVRESLPKPLFVDQFDDATSRIGFGWLCRSPQEGNDIQGISNCIAYLRKLVDSTLDQMKSILCTLDKESTLKALLLNHESIENDSDQWKRTSTHALALHEDKEDVMRVISEQVALRNAGSLASRLAVEICLSEGKAEGGLIAGQLDITKILTYASSLFHLGSWSDAIRFEMIPPRIKISPLGQIMFDQGFNDEVVDPYGMLNQQALIVSESKNYKRYFSQPSVAPSTNDAFEKEFRCAWQEEYGFPIDEGRNILDIIDDIGIAERKAVYKTDRQSLIGLAEKESISADTLQMFLKTMVLKGRSRWQDVPEYYGENDIRPWKFKRRLSLISKPIIEITENEYMVAPSLVRKGFLYLVRNCHDASFEENHFFNKKMRSWVGKERNRIGHQFNADVAKEFIRNGWNAESDVKLTKLLNMKLDKDYGDIDVVAWSERNSKIYLIECKKLELAKTPGEIARQIYDFRGVIRDDGKPDRLFKHLQRINVIEKNIDKLKKYIKLESTQKIVPSLLFSRIVPMSFVDTEPLKKVSLMSFDDIENI
ncbi:MAG: hypothetical protein KME37_02760 [Candidatus Thiodiazotropha sp. (ex Codakia orbicularis)]|nr:hypothetical protein [Candidatus Thiodiazotropha sp. (ex Codakia orbicularis)]